MLEDKAKELGRLIGQSPEYKAVKRANKSEMTSYDNKGSVLRGTRDLVILRVKLKVPKKLKPGTYKLKVTTKSGATREIYLDAATYLDRQHSGVQNLPNNRKYEFVQTFGNWKDVDPSFPDVKIDLYGAAVAQMTTTLRPQLVAVASNSRADAVHVVELAR